MHVVFMCSSGGSISWDIRQSDYTNGSASVNVRLYQRHSWRRSAALTFWSKPLCDASTIANGTALLGDGYLVCQSQECPRWYAASFESLSVQVSCTDFSDVYDFASGEKYSILPLPINGQFIYSYESCCWIDSSTGASSSWALKVMINTYRRVNGK
jgi:hypothetical protein